MPMDYADADDDYYGDDDSSVDDEPYANEEAVQGMITKWSPPKPIEIAAFNPATDGASDDETDPLRLIQKARRENKALHDFCSDQLKTIDAALTINQRLQIAAEEAQTERENWLKTRTKSRETPVRPTAPPSRSAPRPAVHLPGVRPGRPAICQGQVRGAAASPRIPRQRRCSASADAQSGSGRGAVPTLLRW